ncbi:MAG: glutamate-5-semialdehyde dehydrogenase [Planctomycetota bacterium]
MSRSDFTVPGVRQMDIIQAASKAKSASRRLVTVSGEEKNGALAAIAEGLKNNTEQIIAENADDLAEAKRNNVAAPLLKRLSFDEGKIATLCEGIESLIAFDDPVGKTLRTIELDEGLRLYKVSCPIGVVGVIFESRPDALVQISALCLKSGNAVLLKGGSEAARTNRILAEIITKQTEKAKMPAGWLQLLETRRDVADMLGLDEYIDLIVPRGSNEFVRHIMENTNIAVLGHAEGICHVYVDQKADLDMAMAITVDSKCQYAAVCNAAETLLVHKAAAEKFLPKVKAALDRYAVVLVADELAGGIIEAQQADAQTWRSEYLDYKLSVKVVGDLDEAIDHINRYGSGHTDTIVTSDKAAAVKFMDMVDSANVFWNCSTRFSDGFRYGLGAEVGISTNKIHARGPVGLEGLLIYKWKMIGGGHVAADYCGQNARKFTHRKIEEDYGV